jgi:methylmalonyl-CoA/ethylmalonyl-CoA epimerase
MQAAVPPFMLHHVGIVVDSLSAAVPLYCRLLGVAPEDVEYAGVPAEQVRVALLKGNVVVELLEPLAEGTGLAKFREQRGPGIHHLCFAAPPPLQAKLDALKAAGFRLLDEQPRSGADGCVFFVHPKSCSGVLVEFVEC